MNVKLYQIDMERDQNRICFMDYSSLPQFQHTQAIDCAIYDKVFDGELKKAGYTFLLDYYLEVTA